MSLAIRKFGHLMIVDKPCRKLGYCPYGALVEQFPLLGDRSFVTCSVFGHNCPVYTAAEPFQDQSDPGQSVVGTPTLPYPYTRTRESERENESDRVCTESVRQ
jgi:hypothetical protein